MKTMGKRIQSQREDAGMTQDELGKKLGVSRQTICKWEAGNIRHFDRSYIAKMSEIFHCSPAWLMGMENSTATVTYEAPGREPIKLTVDSDPIIGESALRAKLYKAALAVQPRNLEIAIELLESLSKEE